jgi:prevent-host-death family protein
MKRAVSAAEANRNFSKLLREVRDGGSFVITSHGKPVAKIVPVQEEEDRRKAAKAVLLKRLRNQRGVHIGRWKRDELYDEL